MPIIDLITQLFCCIDDHMREVKKHHRSRLYPSELVTLGILFILKKNSQRAFYQWITENYHHLFPNIPERSRLFRHMIDHQEWSQLFLGCPTLLSIIDTYGIELIHPRRLGRKGHQIAKKGISNHRWIAGAKLAMVINSRGEVTHWDLATANVHDTYFKFLIAAQEETIVLADSQFHSAKGDSLNLKVCKRGQWPERILIETVFSLLTRVMGLKRVAHRSWRGLRARLSFAMAGFNVLVGLGRRGVEGSDGFVCLGLSGFVL